MLDSVGDDSSRQCLRGADRFVLRRAVGEHTWYLDDLGDPTPVVFTLGLHCQQHTLSLSALDPCRKLPQPYTTPAQAIRSSMRRTIVCSTGTKPWPSQYGAPLGLSLAKCRQQFA